ncbi:MAG: hypothetical protein CSA50_03590 [Gammaproteobacteria bacterium]|nr:MAG: hypothetical protein CSA50_03590 [Gammaproteobacteria bacterium]
MNIAKNTTDTHLPWYCPQTFIIQLLLAVIAMTSLGACSLTPKPNPTEPAATPPLHNQVPAKPEPEEGDFSPETLYSLLAAEIAGQRNRFDISLLNYVQQARQTKDLGVIKRAMHIARFLKANNAMLELSKTWLEVAPEALDPHQILAFQYIRMNQYVEAIAYMEKILVLGGHADFEALAIHAKTLPAEDQEHLLTLYKTLSEKYPNNQEIGYSYALINRTRGQHEAALDIIQAYLDADPTFQLGLLLKATLLYDLRRIKEALSLLGKATRKFPANRKLSTLYARMLIDDGDLERSEEEYRKLVKRYPDNPGLKLAHALVSLEMGETKTAKQELTALLNQGQYSNEANFYLGRLADDNDEVDTAIKHYDAISSGSHFFNSLARSSYLKAERGELDAVLQHLAQLRLDSPESSAGFWQVEVNLLLDLKNTELALEKVTEALFRHPENTNLLYARAMLFERQDKVAEMELDLRKILALEPNNAVALNALGYTLADKTERYPEALQLISKALELKPDSPAVIDSLGWVYYRMGNTEQALDYLNAAYAKFPDPEVAAHLGEVLWVTKQKGLALKIWQKAYKQDKNHSILNKTLDKFGISFE